MIEQQRYSGSASSDQGIGSFIQGI